MVDVFAAELWGSGYPEQVGLDFALITPCLEDGAHSARVGWDLLPPPSADPAALGCC